jgi:hypothetical protein
MILKKLQFQALLAAALVAAPVSLHAQFNQFTIDGQAFQVHGFASQGYALSNQNNYLTMNTSKGSFAFTDGGLNVSASFGDKLRVGAQGYVRDVGQLGGGRFSLDWAFGDYKFKDWFGVRAGKVKTALGLFTDTQDAESLHTWAILPQSVYPLDLRTSSIAHTGGDVYGEVSLKRAGTLNYTVYAGTRSNDTRSGYYFNTQDTGVPIRTFGGTLIGMDLRWNTPVSGLLLGASFLDEKDDITGQYAAYGNALYTITNHPNHTTAAYVDFTRGKLRVNSELRFNNTVDKFTVFGNTSYPDQSNKGWFVSAAYHLTSRLEVGAYNSRFYIDHPSTTEAAANHIFDQTVTARFDITKFWDLKVEEHFIDGYGDLYSAHGFYLRSNPTGTKPKTDLFIVRTGFYF